MTTKEKYSIDNKLIDYSSIFKQNNNNTKVQDNLFKDYVSMLIKTDLILPYIAGLINNLYKQKCKMDEIKLPKLNLKPTYNTHNIPTTTQYSLDKMISQYSMNRNLNISNKGIYNDNINLPYFTNAINKMTNYILFDKDKNKINHVR